MYEFRRMTHEDVPAVEEVEKSIRFPHWTTLDFRLAIRYGLDCKVAMDNGKVVAYYCVAHHKDWTDAQLMGVSKEYQNHKVGRWAAQQIIEAAKENGSNYVEAEVMEGNHVALNLYESLGAKVVGVRPDRYRTHFGLKDGVVMRLELTKATT